MILGPTGEPLTAVPPLVAPDGTPATAATAATPPEGRPATMADLQALLHRMGVAADGMGAHHPTKQLLIDAAQWMTSLACQCVEQAAQLVAIREGAAKAPRDWRGLRIVPKDDGEDDGA